MIRGPLLNFPGGLQLKFLVGAKRVAQRGFGDVLLRAVTAVSVAYAFGVAYRQMFRNSMLAFVRSMPAILPIFRLPAEPKYQSLAATAPALEDHSEHPVFQLE